jgi:hypothetical protein
MDESKVSTGDKFVLLTDHPMMEEELSVIKFDHDPTLKKKAIYNKMDIRKVIKARCVVPDQRECTAKVC